MLSFLTNVEIDVIIGVVCFLLGLSPLGTKATDWLKGIPSNVRTTLNGVETTVATNIKTAIADAENAVLSKLPVPAAKVAAPAPAPTPAAPAA